MSWLCLPLLAAPLIVLGPDEGPPEVGIEVVEEDELDVRAAWKRAKDEDLAESERGEALRSIAHVDAGQAYLVVDYLSREAKRFAKSRGRAEASLEKRFARSAPRLIGDRIGKREEKAIEADRDLVLGLARSGGLTKAQITAESDPALARLRTLLTISVDDVLVLDETLAEELASYDEALFAERFLLDAFTELRPLVTADPALERRAERLDVPVDPMKAADAMRARMEVVARSATPMGKSDVEVLRDNAATFEEHALDGEEAEGIRIGNDIRILLGLRALRFDPRLGEAARSHSVDMVEHGFFAHDSPVEGRETPWKRAAQAGTSASAENIAAGQSTGAGAIGAWWHSPGHHRNLLGGHSRIGLGRHQRHWTQLFGS